MLQVMRREVLRSVKEAGRFWSLPVRRHTVCRNKIFPFPGGISLFSSGHKGGRAQVLHVEQKVHDVAVAHAPPLVERHVLDAVGGGEIDEILIGFGIDARLEIDAVDAPVVPPVPCDLAVAHPRGGGHAARFGRLPYHVVHGQFGRRRGVGHDAPRIAAPAVDAGDVVGTPLHDVLKAFGQRRLGRVLRETGRKPLGLLVEVGGQAVLGRQ